MIDYKGKSYTRLTDAASFGGNDVFNYSQVLDCEGRKCVMACFGVEIVSIVPTWKTRSSVIINGIVSDELATRCVDDLHISIEIAGDIIKINDTEYQNDVKVLNEIYGNGILIRPSDRKNIAKHCIKHYINKIESRSEKIDGCRIPSCMFGDIKGE